MRTVILDGHSLTKEDALLVARGYYENGSHMYPHVVIAPDVRERVDTYRKALETRIAAGDIMYGVNTGCGPEKNQVIPFEEITAYQAHYIPAHCVGHGDLLLEEIVRLAIVHRVNTLVKGYSAVRLALVEALLALYNAGVIPCVPEQGSVGACGDLCPLAHTAAAVMGIAGQKATYQGETMEAADALAKAGLQPIVLEAKEAMAVTNGATFIWAIGFLATQDAQHLLKMAVLTASLSLEATRAELGAYDPRIQEARNHPDQAMIARAILQCVEGSERLSRRVQDIVLKDERVDMYDTPEGKKPVPHVQEPYSGRCISQVLGPVAEELNFVEQVFEREMNAATDNPLVFPHGEEPGRFEVISGGNFHGEPLAHAVDFAKIAVQALANISERRLYALLLPGASHGLPSDLRGQTNPKVNSGLMILQYMAANLVSENKVLCHPASVDSIPTGGLSEDYVSMGNHGARHYRKVVENAYGVVAAELLAAAQAVSITQAALGNPALGKLTSRLLAKVRELVPEMDDDRYLHADHQKMVSLLRSDAWVTLCK